MNKKATIIKRTNIHQTFYERSPVLGTFEVDEHVKVINEKLREGIVWYEVNYSGKQQGYIKKEDAFVWKSIKIESEEGGSFRHEKKDGSFEKIDFYKGEKMFITLPYTSSANRVRVMYDGNKEGMLYTTVKFSDAEDAWFEVLYWITFIGLILFAIVKMLEADVLIVSGLGILLLAVVAAVGTIITGILVFVIKEIFRQIKIRL